MRPAGLLTARDVKYFDVSCCVRLLSAVDSLVLATGGNLDASGVAINTAQAYSNKILT